MIDLFCIASGPSLTAEDCELIRRSGVKTLAVNDSWQMAPFCNYIYAGDRKWWATHIEEITCQAERWTCSKKAANDYGLNYHYAGGPFNSGMRAIQWATVSGFKKVALLGFDCSIKNGIHWHGPHKGRLLRNPNSQKVKKWHDQFERAAMQADQKGVDVINCSRETELNCFPRVPLGHVFKECAEC